jgi:HAE1 family hydrophobic/amphiphilic exporter-1
MRERQSVIARIVSRPVAVGMGCLALLVVGVLAAVRIPIALVPEDWGEQALSIWVPFPDAHPQEVEEQAIRPLEEEMRTIAGVKSVRSTSREGVGWIRIGFTGQTDLDLAYAEVRDRVERVRPTLPARIPRIGTWRFSMDDMPVVWCAFLFDAGVEGTTDVVEDQIVRRLEAVDGVARVEVWGLLDETVRIYLDEDRVRASRLDLREIVTRLAGDNFALPAGKVEEGGKRFLLRTDAKVRDLEEIASIPLAPGLRVEDLGEVHRVRSVRRWLFRVNGREAFHAGIYRESNANAAEVCGRIRAAFADLGGEVPGFGVQTFFDQGEMIEKSLTRLGETALQGAALAIAVLFVFLRRLRATLLVTAAIPGSILAVLPFAYFRGENFNLLTMMGITLAVGMLVDNAIVVVENVFRLRGQGLPFREAAVKGTREVALAVTVSTLTTVIVFAPLIFLSRERSVRLAMSAMGLPLCVSLLASLALALFVLPTAIRTVLSDRPSWFERRTASIARGGPLAWMRRGQEGLLRWTLRHRILALLAALAMLASYGIPMSRLAKVGDQGDEDAQLEFGLDLPRNLTLAEADAEVGIFERFLLERREDFGFDDLGLRFDRSSAWISLYYDRGLSMEEIRKLGERLREELPKRPGVELRLRLPGEEMGGGGGKEPDSIRIAVVGRDSETLLPLAEEVRARLAADPRFYSVETDVERGFEEMRVSLDRERVRELGVDPGGVRGTIEWALRGFPLPRFEEEGRERIFLVQFDPEGRDDLAHLRDLSVFTERGTTLPLAALAQFEGGKSYREIRRKDGKTRLVVTAKTTEKDTFENWRHAAAALAGMEFPRGYGWEEDEGARDLEAVFRELSSTLFLSIVLVYLLMGILFESSTLPLSILCTIPFAALGAMWALYVTGTPLDPVGFIGIILLVGVVVNNGVVLVDHVNRLRRGGLDRTRAVLAGTADRLRPILMTAATTVLGLLPMALSTANPKEGISYKALAIAVSGGLTTATVFTLWVVPLLYTLVDDFTVALSGAFRRTVAARIRFLAG